MSFSSSMSLRPTSATSTHPSMGPSATSLSLPGLVFPESVPASPLFSSSPRGLALPLRETTAGLIVQHLETGTPLSIVDANNSFPLFSITHWSRRRGLNPRDVLGNLRIRRSFTAIQAVATLESLLSEPVMTKSRESADARVHDMDNGIGNGALVILGLVDAFHDSEVSERDDGARLWLKAMRLLRRLVYRTDALYLVDAPCTHPHWQELERSFSAHLVSSL